jgi:hypothetical protein
MMTGDDLLPIITRPDATVSTFSEWTTGTPERQHAALDAAMDGWADRARPAGLLSYTCFLSTDGSTLRQHTQWTDDEARSRFWSAESPETAPTRLAESRVARIRTIDEVVPGIERDGLAVYDLYRSHLAAGPTPATGCVVIVTIDFEGPDRDRQAHWVDDVVAALESEPEPTPGLIAAHFHRSIDGTTVVNYAEWTSEQAHIDALDHGPDGLSQTDRPEWRRVAERSGAAHTNIKRYREHRTLSLTPATSS